MSTAGKGRPVNEKAFNAYFEDKFGKASLGGKRVFRSEDDDVEISVDQSIESEGQLALIEIDSANMAKLLVGQYVLINTLSSLDRDDAVFVTVHFYKNYNPTRTDKNLRIVESRVFDRKSIPHCAFTFEMFKQVCDQVDNVGALIRELKKRASGA